METEDEKIQRLIKEGVKKGIAEVKANEEFEEKKRKALAPYSWIGMILTSLILGAVMGMLALMSKAGDIFTVGFIFFILMLFILYSSKKSLLKMYESPETLRIAEEKQRKQAIWGIIIVIIIVALGSYFFVFPMLDESQHYQPQTKQTQTFKQSTNQISYPTLYPTYHTGDIIEDADGDEYQLKFTNGGYTNYIYHSTIFIENNTNGEYDYLRDFVGVYDCPCNFETMTKDDFLDMFPYLKGNVSTLTIGGQRNGFIDVYVLSTTNGNRYEDYIVMEAGNHMPYYEYDNNIAENNGGN